MVERRLRGSRYSEGRAGLARSSRIERAWWATSSFCGHMRFLGSYLASPRRVLERGWRSTGLVDVPGLLNGWAFQLEGVREAVEDDAGEPYEGGRIRGIPRVRR